MIKKLIIELTVLAILATGGYMFHKKRLDNAAQYGFNKGFMFGTIITKSKMCKDV